MTYQIKPLSCDPAKIKGMSERLIVSHYENNYGGAVKRLNLIEEQLADLDYAKAAGFLINGLKREQLIAMNSMILHELFFDGLGEQSEPSPSLHDALVGHLRPGESARQARHPGLAVVEIAREVLVESIEVLRVPGLLHSAHRRLVLLHRHPNSPFPRPLDGRH